MRSIPISLASLVPDPDQPRKSLPAAELDQLVASIRDRGLLLPLRVKPANAQGQHVIVSGHRRYAALVKLGAATADCVVTDGPLDEAATLVEQLTENVIRQNLGPIEEAEAYRRYIALKQISAAQAAQELHVAPSRLSRLLPLLELPAAVRAEIDRGVIPQDTAYYLSRLPDGDERTRLIAEAVTGTLSRDAAARSAKTRRATAPPSPAHPVTRVRCNLSGGRSVTFCAAAVGLNALIETLEEVLKSARKAEQQGLGVTTLAKIFRDRTAAKAGGA